MTARLRASTVALLGVSFLGAGCTQLHPLEIAVTAAEATPIDAQWRVRVVRGSCASSEVLAAREPLLAAPFVPGAGGELGRIPPGDVAIAVAASVGCRQGLFGCAEARVPTPRVEIFAERVDQDACRVGEVCDVPTNRCVRVERDAGCAEDGGCEAPTDGGPDGGPLDGGAARPCSSAAECGPTGAFSCNNLFCEERAAAEWTPRAIALDDGGAVRMSDVALELSDSSLHVFIPWGRVLNRDVARISGGLDARGATLNAPTSLNEPFVLDRPTQVASAWDSTTDEVWFAIADATTVAFGYVGGLGPTRFAGMFAIADARPGAGSAPTSLEPFALTAGGPRPFAGGFYPIRFVYRIDTDAGLTSSDFGANAGTFRWVDDAGYDGSPLVPSDSRYVIFADARGDVRLWDSDAPGADDTASGPPLTPLLRGEARRPALYTRLEGDAEHTELLHLVGGEARLHRLSCTDEAGCAASPTANGTLVVPADARLLAGRAMTDGAVLAYVTGDSTIELQLVSRAARGVGTFQLELPGVTEIAELRLRVRERGGVTDVVVAALDRDDANTRDQVWLSGLSFGAP